MNKKRIVLVTILSVCVILILGWSFWVNGDGKQEIKTNTVIEEKE